MVQLAVNKTIEPKAKCGRLSNDRTSPVQIKRVHDEGNAQSYILQLTPPLALRSAE